MVHNSYCVPLFTTQLNFGVLLHGKNWAQLVGAVLAHWLPCGLGRGSGGGAVAPPPANMLLCCSGLYIHVSNAKFQWQPVQFCEVLRLLQQELYEKNEPRGL